MSYFLLSLVCVCVYVCAYYWNSLCFDKWILYFEISVFKSEFFL